MSSTNYINETEEIRENEDLQNFENLSDIEENKEEIKVENQQVDENKNTNLKIRKLPTKIKRNLNPIPTECSICERMASGYIFYGVICCDDIVLQAVNTFSIVVLLQKTNINVKKMGTVICLISIIAAQNKQSLDYLLTVEQNVYRTRDSGIDECHYNSSCNSLASLLTRRENLIAIKHENIGMQAIPKSGRDPIEGFLVFSSPPKPLTDNHYGPLARAKRYAELLHLIEFCFNCGNDHCLFLNYTAYVTDRGYFHNSMPEALLNLCLGCKT
uniref:Uncharacterized protein n=1 Tax=Meloidogyne floridensis TaxID=298350 RepID=A0A915NW85_9BILA